MAKLSALALVEKPQSILIYGPPKSGKTQLASTLVKQGYNLIWLDLENGIQTLKECVAPEDMGKIEVISVPDTLGNPVAIETVTKFFRAAGPLRICERHGRVACINCKAGVDQFIEVNPTTFDSNTVVVVDSLSQLSDSAMAHCLGGIKDMDFKKPEFDHYGKQGLLLANILSAQQQARYHRVFISHEEAIEQEDGTEKLVPVGGTRNFSRKLSRYFDHVVYLYKKNAKHAAASSTTFSQKVLTGSRSDIDLADDKIPLAALLKGKKAATAQQS